jgi:hypothetical protein
LTGALVTPHVADVASPAGSPSKVASAVREKVANSRPGRAGV